MKRICFLAVLMLLTFFVSAQNKTDKEGRRQGQWIDYHDNGKIKSKGSFVNGFPVGEFIYFNERGVLCAKSVYSENRIDASTEIYSENGNVVAKGFYKNKKRNGEWQYFDEIQGITILIETYQNGILDGRWISYYKTGEPQFEGQYKNGVKVGKWITYNPEGGVISVDMHEEENFNAPELEGVELY